MTEKILSLEELAFRAEDLRNHAQRLVLTNGCFDLLHIGHIRYLAQARALGEKLAVAVNGDNSVRELKGGGRPLNPEWERAEVLAALESVSFVTIFESLRATEIILRLRPAIYVKGGDYSEESLNVEERAALQSVGAKIEILPLVPGHSTSSLVARFCNQ